MEITRNTASPVYKHLYNFYVNAGLFRVRYKCLSFRAILLLVTISNKSTKTLPQAEAMLEQGFVEIWISNGLLAVTFDKYLYGEIRFIYERVQNGY